MHVRHEGNVVYVHSVQVEIYCCSFFSHFFCSFYPQSPMINATQTSETPRAATKHANVNWKLYIVYMYIQRTQARRCHTKQATRNTIFFFLIHLFFSFFVYSLVDLNATTQTTAVYVREWEMLCVKVSAQFHKLMHFCQRDFIRIRSQIRKASNNNIIYCKAIMSITTPLVYIIHGIE